MANILERLSPNVTGRFYVDASCIDCGLCRDIAPEFFAFHEELGFSVVHRQPVKSAEIELATEAMNSCPTESIGADGG